MSEKLLLSPMEAAKLLDVGRNTIYSMMRSKSFPTVKIGRLRKVLKSELENWAKQNIVNGGN